MKKDVNYIIETSEKRIDKLEVKMKDEIKDLKGEVKELSNEQKNNLLISEKKLDRKISEYEDKFNSITKEAFRKPNLVCLINDQPIGETINLNRHKAFLGFKIVNQGDATANNIKIFAYIEKGKGMGIHGDFYNYSTIDIDGYLSHVYDSKPFSLDADQSKIIQFAFNWDKKFEKFSANVIIRIFYEQPKPTEYNFTINLE